MPELSSFYGIIIRMFSIDGVVMKLKEFKIKDDYIFNLVFENGIKKIVDISSLIQEKVAKEEVKTAHIDKDWGCIEFKNGMVDIEPNTLYNFVQRQ